MKIYLAGPLFSNAERAFLDTVAARLRALQSPIRADEFSIQRRGKFLQLFFLNEMRHQPLGRAQRPSGQIMSYYSLYFVLFFCSVANSQHSYRIIT